MTPISKLIISNNFESLYLIEMHTEETFKSKKGRKLKPKFTYYITPSKNTQYALMIEIKEE